LYHIGGTWSKKLQEKQTLNSKIKKGLFTKFLLQNSSWYFKSGTKKVKQMRDREMRDREIRDREMRDREMRDRENER
jgi:hypothetical protein